MYYKITDFKKDLIKTLNKIKKERGNTMDDITIIDNNNDALLLYFSQHYDPNDMKSMNEVGKFYVNILKEIFFLKKKLKNNYHFYNIFKDIMFQEIYQSTHLLFLLNDMYDMIVENLTAKDCLNKSKIIKLYYDRITSEEAYNESLQSFILDKLPEFQSTICDLSQRNDETSSSSEVVHQEVDHQEVDHQEVVHQEVVHQEVGHQEVDHQEVVHQEEDVLYEEEVVQERQSEEILIKQCFYL